MKFSYHKDCIGKPERRINEETHRPELWVGDKKINLGYGWRTADLEFEEIYELISTGGYAIAPALTNDNRCEDNFVSHELALVDIDSGMTLAQLQEHPFYKLYGSGYYTTPSHTDTDPRFRIIYRLPCAINDPEAMRIIYQGLLVLHGAADISCKDSARLFYGTVDAKHRELTNRAVDQEGIEIILAAYDIAMAERAAQTTQVAKDDRTFDPVSIDDVAELLDELKKHYADLSYSLRRDVTWAVLSAVPRADGIQLMRARWSDMDKNGKYEMIANDHKRSTIKIGTIYHMIRQHDPNFRKKQTGVIGSETASLAKKMLEKLK